MNIDCRRLISFLSFFLSLCLPWLAEYYYPCCLSAHGPSAVDDPALFAAAGPVPFVAAVGRPTVFCPAPPAEDRSAEAVARGKTAGTIAAAAARMVTIRVVGGRGAVAGRQGRRKVERLQRLQPQGIRDRLILEEMIVIIQLIRKL